ncbi:MAG: hypothetical protein AseanaTS_20370 [Candidatus Pelagadaptatus aseana]
MTQQALTPGMPQAPQAADPLAQLRDIHLPQEAISNLPLAPGWWLLALLLITAISTAIVLWRRQRQRNRYRQEALTHLGRIETQQNSDQSLLQAINTLLKRTAIAAYPCHFSGNLHGESWLDFLQHSSGISIPEDLRQFWIDSSYARPKADNHQALQQQICQFARSWIRQHRHKLDDSVSNGGQTTC